MGLFSAISDVVKAPFKIAGGAIGGAFKGAFKGGLIGGIAAVCLAPFTGGASLAALPLLLGGGAVGGALIGGTVGGGKAALSSLGDFGHDLLGPLAGQQQPGMMPPMTGTPTAFSNLMPGAGADPSMMGMDPSMMGGGMPPGGGYGGTGFGG